MARVTKSNTAKKRHKKVLSATKTIMVLEVDYIKQPSNLILKLCNMLLEIEKIEKDPLGTYGSLESTLHQES